MNSLRRILDHLQMIRPGNLQDFIHCACHTGIVYRHDSLRLLRDRIFDLIFIKIHGVRPDINEHDPGSPEHERIGRRYERIGRHDHLIPGWMSARYAAISSAWVHEVVSSTSFV